MKLGEWIGLISILATIYILWSLRAILLLVFTAIVVAIALNSLTRRLQKKGIPRRVAIPMILSISFLSIALFFLVLVPPFIQQFGELSQRINDGYRNLPTILTNLEVWLETQFQNLPGQPNLPQFDTEFFDEFLNWATSPDSAVLDFFNDVFSNFFSVFNSSVQVLAQVLLVLILSLMFLGNPGTYRSALLRLIPSFYRRRADEIFEDCEIALCNWMGGIILNCVFIFLLSFVGLVLLGIDFPLANALLAGVLNFIPNVGPSLSVIFPAIVALLSEDPWIVIPVVIWYVIIQQIESYWLTPTVMARQISLPPAFTLIAQICFFAIFGFLGLVLALPLAVVAKIWMQELLIKDIFDQWEMPGTAPWNPVLAAVEEATTLPEPPEPPASLPDEPPSGNGVPPSEENESPSPLGNNP